MHPLIRYANALRSCRNARLLLPLRRLQLAAARESAWRTK